MNEKKIRNIFNDKFVTILGSLLSLIFVLALIVNCTLMYQAMTNKEDIPSVNGIYPLIVLTDSMNPLFHSGDMIICQKVKSEDIKVGDVISYYDSSSHKNSVVTHRVVEITRDEHGYTFKTKGDANNTADDTIVSSGDVIGVYKTKIAHLGHIVLFMQSKTGLVVCVIFPVIFLCIYEMLLRKKDMKALKKELEQLKTLSQ